MDEAHPKVTDALLEAVKDGDAEANDRLVRLLYPLVQTNVRRHIRQSADQDDVAQEIFMKIFLKIGQYRGPQPFEHWVSRVAVTTCHDWLRKLRARPLTTYADLGQADREWIARSLSGDLGGESAPRRDLAAGLLDALIASLKPREQIVIRLLDLEELSIKDVTEATGWSVSKVKTTAMRARRKLAERLRRLERCRGATSGDNDR